jgi:ketosteroid isomerase-like protein
VGGRLGGRRCCCRCRVYDEDAVLLPQNEPPAVGKTAIRSNYEAFFEEFSIKGSAEVAELEVGGDWGFMRGAYTTTVVPKRGGQPIVDRGNWLWIVKRQPDNSWKICRAIDVSEPPASGEGGRDASG